MLTHLLWMISFFLRACSALDYHIDWSRIRPNKHLWCYLLYDIICNRYGLDMDNMKIRNILEVCRNNMTIQVDYLLSGVDSLSKIPMMKPTWEWISKKFTSLPIEIQLVCELTYTLAGYVEMMAQTVDVSLRSSEERVDKLAQRSYIKDTKYNMSFAWSENLLFMKYKEFSTILPRPYFLLLHNKSADLLSILLYAYFNTGASLDSNCYDLTVAFVKNMSLLHQRYQNQAMKLSKSLEALGIGLTLIECDGETNSSFLNEILNNLQIDLGDRFVTEEFFKILQMASIPLRHELMCLSKVFGHHFVDMIAGAEKLHKKTTMNVDVDQQLLDNCVRYAKRSFIKNYILKHGRWPPVLFLRQTPVLPLACLRNRDPDSSIFTTAGLVVDIEDYDSVELRDVMNFNYLDNIIPNLKDKTISVLRSKVVKKYINNEQIRMNWEETRLLLMYLLHDIDTNVHQDYIKRWCSIEPLDFNLLQDYLVIRIVPKEKELKVEFRGFGCKTYEDRMRTICQELNVADYMDSYCNEQALTLSELEISKRLCSFRRIQV